MSKCLMIGLYSLFLVIVAFSVVDSGELNMGGLALDAELQKLKQAGIPATIEELRQKADFRLISNEGQQESHPHDIRITREPPNYSSMERFK